MRLFRIVRASGGRRFGARALTSLIGREEELDRLRRRWERAAKGEGQFIHIVGEPGIGKSRVAEEFRAGLGGAPHTFVSPSRASGGGAAFTPDPSPERERGIAAETPEIAEARALIAMVA